MISGGGKCVRNHSKPSKTSPEVIFERIRMSWFSRPVSARARWGPSAGPTLYMNSNFSLKFNFGRMIMWKHFLWSEISQFDSQKVYRTGRTTILSPTHKTDFSLFFTSMYRNFDFWTVDHSIKRKHLSLRFTYFTTPNFLNNWKYALVK